MSILGVVFSPGNYHKKYKIPMLSQIFNLSGLLQFDHTLDQKTFILSL